MHLFAVLAVKHALPCYHVYELDFFFLDIALYTLLHAAPDRPKAL